MRNNFTKVYSKNFIQIKSRYFEKNSLTGKFFAENFFVNSSGKTRHKKQINTVEKKKKGIFL